MLNAKQQRFVDEYLVDLNATQAAMRAGYSERTANEQGARLLAHVSVAAAIASGIAARSERTKVSADWVLRRLEMEAEADLADLYDDGGNLLPVKQWPLIWRQGLVAGVETVREKGKEGDDESFVDKIKISDRVKRIELLGKHVDVQAFKERVEVDFNDDIAKALADARKAAGR
ncbi:terminase small subunit [Sphingopyxis sp. Geo48]|uniref:terminase small subunit n=1 Tax=Sphingopyxis sp. Geo48 TaxID=545241 RepID=UPI0024B6A25C|nr:terminase small subunit [Sphingopyxis sp. Geo48]